MFVDPLTFLVIVRRNTQGFQGTEHIHTIGKAIFYLVHGHCYRGAYWLGLDMFALVDEEVNSRILCEYKIKLKTG